MEIESEQLIDVALNMVGFVLAGILMAVIHSMIYKKEKAVRKSEVAVEANSNAVSIAAKANTGANIEFIDFQSKGASMGGAPIANETKAYQPSQFQRNRMEVIKQATDMLSGGQAPRNIRRSLPMRETRRPIFNQGRRNLSKMGVVNDQ